MESFPKEKMELARYLAGYPEYAIINRDADTPTDPILALKPLLLSIRENRAILETLTQSLLLLSQDSQYGWMAIYYVLGMVREERRQNTKLLSPEIVTTIGKFLIANREGFSKAQLWMGNGLEKGIWGDISRINHIILEDYGVIVIPESDL